MDTKSLTKQAIVAAVYTAISLALAPVSFGLLQFRIAEALMVLPFYNKKHTIGLTIGCLLTNMFSPVGLIDIVFGTAATLLACLIISHLPSLKFVAVTAALINGVIIGLMLYFFIPIEATLVATMATIALEEFVVVQLGVVAMVPLGKRISFLS